MRLEPTNAAQVNTDITTIENYLAALTPGTPRNNTYKYSGNLYATYPFAQGALKNFAFGGDANLRGQAKIASSLTNVSDYRYADRRRPLPPSASGSRDWRGGRQFFFVVRPRKLAIPMEEPSPFFLCPS